MKFLLQGVSSMHLKPIIIESKYPLVGRDFSGRDFSANIDNPNKFLDHFLKFCKNSKKTYPNFPTTYSYINKMRIQYLHLIKIGVTTKLKIKKQISIVYLIIQL